jgi:hypothetical protein
MSRGPSGSEAATVGTARPEAMTTRLEDPVDGTGRPDAGGAEARLIPPDAAVGEGFRSAARDAATLTVVGAEYGSGARLGGGFSAAFGLAGTVGAGGYTPAQSSGSSGA